MGQKTVEFYFKGVTYKVAVPEGQNPPDYIRLPLGDSVMSVMVMVGWQKSGDNPWKATSVTEFTFADATLASKDPRVEITKAEFLALKKGDKIITNSGTFEILEDTLPGEGCTQPRCLVRWPNNSTDELRWSSTFGVVDEEQAIPMELTGNYQIKEAN